MNNLLAIISLISTVIVVTSGDEQSAGVRGVLMCDGKPMSGTLVKLYDDDRGIDTDDLLDEGTTDSQGRFELSGSTTEITSIDPKLNIYHDCNDLLPCQRKISIMIPDDYISTGPRPKKIYDAGTMNMAGKFDGESRDCLHLR